MDARDIARMAAFLPINQNDIGQCVKVYFRDGDMTVVSVGLRSFLQQLAKVFSINLQESRRRLGPIIGQKNLIPLVLTPVLLYVPLKARKPDIMGDSAYGYFRLRSLKDVAADPKPSTLTLEGDHKITITQSYRVVCSRLRAARKLEAHIFEQYYETMAGEKHNLADLRQN